MYPEFKNGIENLRASRGDNKFSTVITGDCCPWENAIETIRSGHAAEILKPVKPFIDSADLKIIQFETPLTRTNTPIYKSGPNIKCPPECLDLVKAGSFNVALLANNHTGDHGPAVAIETIEHLNSAGIKTVGAGRNLAEAGSPLCLEYSDITIKLLNFAENEFGTAGPDKAGCAPLNPLENIKAIKAAKQDADLVFVVIHGGHEHNPAPSPRMVATYRAFAEAGAAVVVNIHTHCPEGIEIWNGTPIVYSPGNLFFPWQDLTADHLGAMWWTGYMPKFHCDREGVYAMEIMPYRFDNERIYALNKEEREHFLSYMAELNRLIVDPNQVKRYFEGWVAKNANIYFSILSERLAAWPINLKDKKAVHHLLPVRNCFTCESHNDLITTFLRLIEEQRVDQAMLYAPAIKRLQRPAWAYNRWQDRLKAYKNAQQPVEAVI